MSIPVLLEKASTQLLSYNREHFSNTDLSDLRIVDTYEIFVYMYTEIVTKSCYSPYFFLFLFKRVINLLHHVSLKRVFDLVMCEMFSQMF